MEKVSVNLLAQSDQYLLTEIQNGNNIAFDLLMQRHSAHLAIYLHTLLHNSEWEHDALQNLWMKVLFVFRNHQYHENGHFLKWLNTLAYNSAMRILRIEKHYIHKGELPELKDEGYKPEQEKDDEDEIVRTEFNKLRTFQKRVILLHYKLKMTYQEIGLKMNLNPHYVAKIYKRALIKLRISSEKRKQKKYFSISVQKNEACGLLQ